MKPAHKTALKVLLVLVLIAVLVGIFTPAQAACWHCGSEQGPPGADGSDGQDGADGVDGIDGEAGLNGVDGKDGKNAFDDSDYWSDDDLDEMFAASTAMAGIDFDSTTSKLQLGVAVGGYGGEQQGAVGIGKVLNNDKFGDVLVSFKTTIEETGRDDERPWVASATWKVRID